MLNAAMQANQDRQIRSRHSRGVAGVLGGESVYMLPDENRTLVSYVGSNEVPQRIDVGFHNTFPFNISRVRRTIDYHIFDVYEIKTTALDMAAANGMTAAAESRHGDANQVLIHLGNVGYFMLNFPQDVRLNNTILSNNGVVLARNHDLIGTAPFLSVEVTWAIAVNPPYPRMVVHAADPNQQNVMHRLFRGGENDRVIFGDRGYPADGGRPEDAAENVPENVPANIAQNVAQNVAANVAQNVAQNAEDTDDVMASP